MYPIIIRSEPSKENSSFPFELRDSRELETFLRNNNDSFSSTLKFPVSVTYGETREKDKNVVVETYCTWEKLKARLQSKVLNSGSSKDLPRRRPLIVEASTQNLCASYNKSIKLDVFIEQNNLPLVKKQILLKYMSMHQPLSMSDRMQIRKYMHNLLNGDRNPIDKNFNDKILFLETYLESKIIAKINEILPSSNGKTFIAFIAYARRIQNSKDIPQQDKIFYQAVAKQLMQWSKGDISRKDSIPSYPSFLQSTVKSKDVGSTQRKKIPSSLEKDLLKIFDGFLSEEIDGSFKENSAVINYSDYHSDIPDDFDVKNVKDKVFRNR